MKYSLLPVLLISTALKYDSAKVQIFDSIVNFSTPKTVNKFATNLAQLPLEQQSEGAIAQDSEAKRVQQDVVKIIQAMFNDNLDILLNYTHPKVINLMGGKAQARNMLETANLSSGIEMESLTFPESPRFIESSINNFVVVPTTIILSSEGYRIQSSSFQFGVKEKGTKDWKYLDGSRMNQQSVRVLFPDFPSDYKFPEYFQRIL